MPLYENNSNRDLNYVRHDDIIFILRKTSEKYSDFKNNYSNKATNIFILLFYYESCYENNTGI